MQEEHDHYQSMVAGPKVLGHEIQSDERQRAWLIDGQFLVRCSPLEYQVLALFFRKANSLITYTYLYHLYHVGGEAILASRQTHISESYE